MAQKLTTVQKEIKYQIARSWPKPTESIPQPHTFNNYLLKKKHSIGGEKGILVAKTPEAD